MGRRGRYRGQLQPMREAGAASASPALERAETAIGGVPRDLAKDGDLDAETGHDFGGSGDGDQDDMTCPTCNGTGSDNGGHCDTCNGTGTVQSMSEDDSGNSDGDGKDCTTCDGTGKILAGNRKCPDCNGTGKMSESTGRLKERDFSDDQRKKLAGSGAAMPDGSYPIENTEDLGNAIQAIGRAKNPSATKAHIIKRAKVLNATSQLPDDWQSSGTKESMAKRVSRLEVAVRQLTQIREAKPTQLNQTYGGMSRVKNSQGQDGYQVTLIREGKGNSEDDQWYTDDAIKEMCESGRAEGMQAYANHPDLEEEDRRPERDVRHLIGQHTDVQYVREGGLGTAKSVFIPITTDESHPTYGWVTTLAEAAARNKSSQPLCGWSLYGSSAGDYGKRPDMSEGRMVHLILPASGDLVTNAGAGGEFARRLMAESARRLRLANTTKESPVMRLTQFRTEMAEALKQVREASTDEARTIALKEVERLQTEAAKIDAPLQVPDSIESLTKAAPALVTQLREAVKVEAGTEVTKLREQLAQAQGRLKEADTFISGITNVRQIADVLRECEVTDPVEMRYFASQAQTRGLREAADIRDMVKTERDYQAARQTQMIEKLREVTDLPDIEGVFSRVPEGAADDGGRSFFANEGVSVKTPAAV